MKKNFLKILAGVMLLSTVVFTSCEDDPLSDLTGFTSFMFEADVDIPGIETLTFTVNQVNMTVANTDSLPYMTDVSALVANFEAVPLSSVMVGQVEQVSGVTVNDFTQPVVFDVTAEDGVTVISYTVSVNVSKINPDGVSWVKEIATINTDTYETLAGTFFAGKHWAIFGSMAGNVATSKLYSSTDGKAWSEATIDAETFPIGARHDLVVYDGALYVLASYTVTYPWGPDYAMPGVSNDVWKTTDGTTFAKITGESMSVPYGGKLGFAAFEFDNALWVVGGNTTGFGNPNGTTGDNGLSRPAGLSQQIHTTTDFLSWTEAEADTIVVEATRRYSANIVHNGMMFMIGGQMKDGSLSSDVWASNDGTTWTLKSTDGFDGRMKSAVISYDSKLWMFGGQTALGVCSSEILVSEDDGATWMAPADDALLPEGFSPRAGHIAYLDADNKVWIIGGYTATTSIDNSGEEPKTVEELTFVSDAWSGKLNKL